MTAKISLGAQPLLYPEPALLICTYDADGKPNVMTAAWAGICNSSPVNLMVAVQPPRWTHDALLAREAFTVCVPSAKLVAETDFFGMVSGRKCDKFAVTGLTAVKAEKVDAPYIAECPVILECTLSQSLSLGSHTVMIGEIVDVKADKDCLDTSGKSPDIEKIRPIIFDVGSRSYYGVGEKIAQAWSAGKSFVKNP